VPEPAPAGKTRRRVTVDSLFADGRPQAVGVADLANAKEIRLDRIVPDPDQPRRTFDEDRLAELADSIRREGLLQPIAVRYDTARDVYVVIHGERRFRAHQALGLEAIAAIVRDVPEERRLVQQLMENIVRDDLNAVDRAAALRALKTHLGDPPWETVADAVGIRRSRLFQLLGTEKLPGAAREDIRGGRMNEKQSRALQGLPETHQEALRKAIVDDDIPASEAMRIARGLKREPADADAASLARAIDRLRGAGSAEAMPAMELLGRIEALAGGGPADARRLRQLADDAGAPDWDAGRLEVQVLGLAQTMARMPAAELRAGSAGHRLLASLRAALDSMLPE